MAISLQNVPSPCDVVIIGGGLSGLTCARYLEKAGISWVLLERSDDIGGRVRTDRIEGFLLDRGFQVLLSAYPEARAELDMTALDLRPFSNGAMIRCGNTFHTLSDPWRAPSQGAMTLFSRVGSLMDKLRIAQLRDRLMAMDLDHLYSLSEVSTRAYLKQLGFSEAFIREFFVPFFGGIFMESELETSKRHFDFVFKMMSHGTTCLPNGGMHMIPRQLAEGLPPERIILQCRVNGVAEGKVRLTTGEILTPKTIVIATDPLTAGHLCPEIPPVRMTHSTCLYFAAPSAPISDPVLVLNGTGKGPVNNLCVPSNVAPGYAPGEEALVSLTCIGLFSDLLALERAVRDQMADWFGASTSQWRHLKTGVIHNALPQAYPGTNQARPQSPMISEGLTRKGIYVCGDHRDTASINGAISSGKRAAQAVMQHLNQAS